MGPFFVGSQGETSCVRVCAYIEMNKSECVRVFGVSVCVSASLMHWPCAQLGPWQWNYLCVAHLTCTWQNIYFAFTECTSIIIHPKLWSSHSRPARITAESWPDTGLPRLEPFGPHLHCFLARPKEPGTPPAD